MKKLLSNTLYKAAMLLFGLVAIGFINGCIEEELPGAGSIPDEIPPSANFSYASDPEDFRVTNFTNLSTEALSFVWDFGGGNTSTEKDPTFTFSGEGKYAVTLTATDGLGVSNAVTIEVSVQAGPYQPIIMEPGFEDGQLEGGSGDGRDSWRNNDLGGVIQITGSPVVSGDQGAKLPGGGDKRVGYQEIIVEPETNYDINFIYTMLAEPTGYITVDILDVEANGGTFTSHADTQATLLGSVTVNDQDDPETYVAASVSFSSGTTSKIAIYFYNDGIAEARLDDFTIEIGRAGAVPPSASFSVEQSESNFLEYSFKNSSLNAATYAWDFGDGNTSTEKSPTHTYAEAGVYAVTLETKSEGGLTADFSTNIDIQAPVTAAFTYEIDPDDYKTYTFTDASEDAVMLLWEFGDGYQFTGMNPVHDYAEDGVYTVTLTAYSVTGNTDVASEEVTVAQGFVVKVLNGTFDDHTASTGDNADSWDMTPNSTILDEGGNEVPSPYAALWNNSALNDYIDATYCTNEQIGSTSDGNNGTRGGKISDPCRRLYQVVEVEQGVEYTFSIDTRSEAEGINTEVFILNTEITTEAGIDASKSDPAIDAYFDITNDFNTDKTVFTTSTFTFTPSTNEIVIYARALNAIDSSNEVFIDNVEITEN
ncbi:PKD domain-containing protein [Fulvivirga lutimaris]|uniref:PKD domain-containing protein n=1 Tax=Fulvivirga lutimaris TaxID=1819566 RepID=UPI0012BD0122|nr:PKD domain-containing protein [Fulvivirga lutimaris]MTI40106.1 PKD domain-containing protein [Fulvivirga lutimaris]